MGSNKLLTEAHFEQIYPGLSVFALACVFKANYFPRSAAKAFFYQNNFRLDQPSV